MINTANFPTFLLGLRRDKQGPRSLVGNHVGVDKSATGRLLRCKINTLVSTFNIRSLNSIEMIGELTALTEEKGISVVCLQEQKNFTIVRTCTILMPAKAESWPLSRAGGSPRTVALEEWVCY